jgi:iron-sulfur cluster repair protein YtfE (RIC family)
MNQQRDREQLERKLEQCRRLSRVASDPTTPIRFAKLIEELEHSLQEAD